VGTVLAYYFSRKNFETASQSVERMVTLTTDQRLAQLSVDEEMLKPSDITLCRISVGMTLADFTLRSLRGSFTGQVTRLPIVDEKGVVSYILHQSGLFKFVADQALAGKSPAEIEKLTLKDLVQEAEVKDWVANIAYTSEGSTVAEAKRKMELQAGCQDLVVTRTGAKTEPMLGWMTNVHIGRLSKA